jgi:hypothetical protein
MLSLAVPLELLEKSLLILALDFLFTHPHLFFINHKKQYSIIQYNKIQYNTYILDILLHLKMHTILQCGPRNAAEIENES